MLSPIDIDCGGVKRFVNFTGSYHARLLHLSTIANGLIILTTFSYAFIMIVVYDNCESRPFITSFLNVYYRVRLVCNLRCKYGRCTTMPTAIECVCCLDESRKPAEFVHGLQCITDHADFATQCTNSVVLDSVHELYVSKYGSHKQWRIDEYEQKLSHFVCHHESKQYSNI